MQGCRIFSLGLFRCNSETEAQEEMQLRCSKICSLVRKAGLVRRR